MKAIQITEFAPQGNLQLVELAQPSLTSNQLLVKTHSCGINPIDWKTCQGGGASPFIGELPFVPGWEFSGTVEQSDNTAFPAGTQVVGLLNFPAPASCFAEYIAANSDQIAIVPDRLPLDQAATLPTAGMTALQAIDRLLEVTSANALLILGAAGGVGHIAVQLAKAKGLTVIATASPRNHAWLRELGADQVIDYHQTDALEGIKAEAILDCVGGETPIEALPNLATDGLMITLPSVTKDKVIDAASVAGKQAEGLRVIPNGAQLQSLIDLAAAGKLKGEIAQVYSPEQIQQGFLDSAAGHTRGKRLLSWGG